MAMFGSSWDEDEYDDGPMGISSSMKEDIRRDGWDMSSSSNGLGHSGFQPLDADSNSAGDSKQTR